MSIVAIDGFDHYSATTDLGYRVGKLKWSYYANNAIYDPNVGFTTGRGGYGSCLQLPGYRGGALVGTLNANYNEIIIGFAVKIDTTIGSISYAVYNSSYFNRFNVVFRDWSTGVTNGAAQCIVSFFPKSGVIQVYKGDGVTLLASSLNDAFNSQVWQFIEIKVVIDNSTGSVSVNVQNQSVVSAVNIDTQVTPNAYLNGVDINTDVGITGSPGSLFGFFCINVDDFYLCDTTVGPGIYPCDDFLGDHRVATLYPTANGAISWTPLSGTNWQEVSETHFDGDATYNYSSTVGQEDLFSVNPLVGTVNTVLAVQITGAYRKTDSSPRYIAQHISSGGTDGAATPQQLAMSYSYLSDIFVLDPNTGANWTTAAVNSMNIGYSLTT